jgi:hypothetical protein
MLYLLVDILSYRYHKTRYMEPSVSFRGSRCHYITVCIGGTHVQLRRSVPTTVYIYSSFSRLFRDASGTETVQRHVMR